MIPKCNHGLNNKRLPAAAPTSDAPSARRHRGTESAKPTRQGDQTQYASVVGDSLCRNVYSRTSEITTQQPSYRTDEYRGGAAPGTASLNRIYTIKVMLLLQWVPGHRSIKGNKLADRYARAAAESWTIDSEGRRVAKGQASLSSEGGLPKGQYRDAGKT